MSGTIVGNRLLRVRVPKEIFDRSDWVKYLIIVDWHTRIIDKEFYHAATSERFNEFVQEHLQAYMIDKKAPPKAIATTIMNIADDILSGRDPVLRAGDYVELQNFMRR
jgi:hypothetical protein